MVLYVVLPQTVTSIADSAFEDVQTLNTIFIPKEVTVIGNDAFKGCDNVVIQCYSNSAAHKYAVDNGFKFELVDLRSYILGDADNDVYVTILDATHIQKVLAKLIEDTDGTIAIRGDVDKDSLSVIDATNIQKYLAKFKLSYDIGGTYNY